MTQCMYPSEGSSLTGEYDLSVLCFGAPLSDELRKVEHGVTIGPTCCRLACLAAIEV